MLEDVTDGDVEAEKTVGLRGEFGAEGEILFSLGGTGVEDNTMAFQGLQFVDGEIGIVNPGEPDVLWVNLGENDG